MLWPLLLMFLGFMLYFVAVLLIRLRAELLRRERNASWVREVVHMSEFFDMGGYGKYLWPSFALGFGVVVLNLVLALSSLRARQAGSAAAHWR